MVRCDGHVEFHGKGECAVVSCTTKGEESNYINEQAQGMFGTNMREGDDIERSI